MALSTGTRLGPYEILSALGAGGMGEVYRGRDTRLERIVAIKILPDTLAGDPQFRERFDREARAISQLDHPHICAVYDVGEQPSSGAGPATAYLVMQYLEGETLADRLAKGALPFDQALRTAIEIAGALDKAHRSGIVHRDLKPANVMLTKAGAKLLDFGLAKAAASGAGGAGRAGGAIGLSMLPTTPANLTMQGTIIGTFQYMAPEQLEGKEADARTDIFAFGALLYEMVTGRKAFEGKSQASLISAIMATEPAPVSSVQALAPSTLDQIVRTCLAKDPDERWQTAADVERQLKWIAEGRSHSGASMPLPVVTPPVRRTRTIAVAGVSGLAGALVAAAALWSWGGNASASPPTRASLMLPANRPVASLGFPTRSIALSPDGRLLVYVGTNLDAPADRPGGRAQLQLRSLDALMVRDLPGTTGARQPFFSPDGQWVAFFTTTGELKKVSLAGGNPVMLLEKINGSQWGFGVWTDDNTIIFGTPQGSNGLLRVPADGGETTALTTLDAAQQEDAHFPALVPSTGTVLFSIKYRQLRNPRIDAVMLDSGERRVVVENGSMPIVLSTGHLIFRRDEAILIAPFDAERLILTGPAVPLIDEVRRDNPTSPFPIPQLAVSRYGTLAYVPGVAGASELALVDRGGSFERLGPSPNQFGTPRVSGDGQYVAFVVPGGLESEVHVYDLLRGNTTKLTQDGSDSGPSWRPGSRSLAVISVRPNASGIFLKNLDGSERLLVARPSDVAVLRNASWSADGTLLAYTAQTGNRHDIWVLTMGDTPTTKPFLNSAAAEHSPTFAPDGRWLAYVSDESGRQEVYVRGYPTGERFAVSTGGGNGPVWRPDGREIFFQGPYEDVQKLMAVSVTPDGDSLRLAKPVPLFDMRVPGATGVIEQYAISSNSGPMYDVLPDGKRFVMIRGADPLGTREIVLVQNWFEELKRLAPVK